MGLPVMLVHAWTQALLGFVVLGVVAAMYGKVASAVSLSAAERERFDRVEKVLLALEAQSGLTAASGARIEAASAVVAGDLADAHARADAREGQPGEAADAASRSA